MASACRAIDWAIKPATISTRNIEKLMTITIHNTTPVGGNGFALTCPYLGAEEIRSDRAISELDMRL